MKNATQAQIASAAQITRQMVNNYLAGRKNASAPIADRLASLTGTDIRVWLKGGNPVERQAAVQSLGESD